MHGDMVPEDGDPYVQPEDDNYENESVRQLESELQMEEYLKKKLQDEAYQASYSQTDDESNMVPGDGESCTYKEEEDNSLEAASPSLRERSHLTQQLQQPLPPKDVF